MTKIELLESIGALEEGVIIPTCNIREQLSKMECGEARKAKRKWRKLMRKAKKQIPEGQNISKNANTIK